MYEKAIQKICGIGFPAIVLSAVISSTGLTGAAAITSALALLGGPAGMLGGITALVCIGLIADAVTGLGIEAILKFVYDQRSMSIGRRASIEELSKLREWKIISQCVYNKVLKSI